MQLAPVIGQPAPDFTLPSTAGKDVTLLSHRGNSHVLLASFPLAFTGTAKERMSLHLLSGFKREVCRLYGTLLEDKFFSRRAYYLSDKRGIPRWTHTEAELRLRRQHDELITEIRKPPQFAVSAR